MHSREVDYLIIGAGMAGMSVERMLRDESTVLLDPRPGKYKIGESVIPEHFAHPLLRDLYPIVCALPSATPKEATIFASDVSLGWFPLFTESPHAIHVDRREFEQATAQHFGTQVTRERVESVDVESGRVTTDAGTWTARKLVIDCSGPARILARTLGLAREVWPVWASWAYHDVVDTDVERFWDIVRREERQCFCFDNATRQLVPGKVGDPFSPVHATILTRVADGIWSWQIPLFRATRLSVGIVSRHGPVSLDDYVAATAKSIAPHFRTRLRPHDGSGPHNAFHVRNRFAWTSDRFAGARWALVGDAAFFGDPVYSVGTGLATNHALQLGALVKEGGWTEQKAAVFQTRTAQLYERAKCAYDHWYFGNIMASPDVANEIQTDFLNGQAFQVQSTASYTSMWDVAGPSDRTHMFGYRAPDPGADVTRTIADFLEDGQLLAGWKLDTARALGGRLHLEWSRPDTARLVVVVCRAVPGEEYYASAGELGLRYRKSVATSDSLDGQGRALMGALARVAATGGDRIKALL